MTTKAKKTFANLPQYGDSKFELNEPSGLWWWSGADYVVCIAPSPDEDKIFDVEADGVHYFTGDESDCYDWIFNNMDKDRILTVDC